MNILIVLIGALAVLLLAGNWYSRLISRVLGEDSRRVAPSVAINDGRDYVPTRTPIVFAHHFASIAGAGPIIGPVVAMYYGWGPVLAWLLLGGLFIGAVHDYAATHVAMREGGHGIVHTARVYLGKTAFIMLSVFVVALLSLVCAAFLNLSAAALGSMVPVAEMGIENVSRWFRVETINGVEQAVVGGVASMSVVVITCCAPLVGYLYIKRKVSVWVCSAIAVVVCAVSLWIGLCRPIAVEPSTWKVLISIYVLAASGLPVWMLIQSRDFINVHILYVGVAFLMAALLAAGLGGAGVALSSGSGTASDAIPFVTIDAPAAGMKAPADLVDLGPIWPGMFILIACGAVSGFHALCAGGTTCKQITSEGAARRVGYWAMILETFMAVCVTGVLVVGLNLGEYAKNVHPEALGLQRAPNWILGFALSVGNTAEMGLGIPKAFGVIGAMLMLEGFLVTTLDTAVRLTRYLLEEIWAALLESPAGDQGDSLAEVAGSGSIPVVRAAGLPARVLRHYWFNSALAVGLMLCLALTNGVGAIWPLFASGNQLLAALALLVASVWLLRSQRSIVYTLVPGVLVLVTTLTMLVKLLLTYVRTWTTNPQPTLLVADIILLGMTLVILAAIGRTLISRPTRPSGVKVPVVASKG